MLNVNYLNVNLKASCHSSNALLMWQAVAI